MGDQEQGANAASESSNFEVKDPTAIISNAILESSLVKIYLGGLPQEFDENGLKSMLNDKNLPEAESVLVKRGGYAFLEFGDQSKADEVIAILDGMCSILESKTQKSKTSSGNIFNDIDILK